MKTVCVNGSPRGRDGNTAIMLDSLLAGFGRESVACLALAELDIAGCRGCHACWTATPGTCCQHDDMAGCLEAFRDADLMILGSPLYFNNVSGTFKNFIDRLTALGGNPHASREPRTRKPGIVMVSSCGFADRRQFDAVSLWARHFAAMLGADLIAEIYATESRLLAGRDEVERQAASGYTAYLEVCGRSIRERGSLFEELSAGLTRAIGEFR